MILNNDSPEDFVVSSMKTHSVRDMVNYVFSKLDLDVDTYVSQDPKFIRPEELKYLKGDSSKIRKELSWSPEYTFESMLDEMINYWLEYYGKK
jgi:GDPmannose 4,6-dehydratase